MTFCAVAAEGWRAPRGVTLPELPERGWRDARVEGAPPSPPADALPALAWAAFTDTHHGTEVTRVGVPGWGSPLITPLAHGAILAATEPPTLVLLDGSGSTHHEILWSGDEPWGRSGAPRADRGLPGPGQAHAEGLRAVSGCRVSVLFEDDARGSTLVEIRRRGARWSWTARPPPAVEAGAVRSQERGRGVEPCASGRDRVWSYAGDRGPGLALRPLCEGTWTRLGQIETAAWGFAEGADALVALPRLPDCPECGFERGVTLANGDVLASFIDPTSRDARLARLSGGEWVEEAVPPEVAGAGVAALAVSPRDRRTRGRGTRSPLPGAVAWAVFSGSGGLAVARRDPAGWTLLPDPDRELGALPIGRESLDFFFGATLPLELAVGPDGQEVFLLLAPGNARDLLVARQDGGQWTREVVARDVAVNHDARLAVRRTGEPVLALADPTGVRVFERTPEGWQGLGERDGRAWQGAAEGVALGVDRRDRVCVAFTAPDVRTRRIGLLCHRGRSGQTRRSS